MTDDRKAIAAIKAAVDEGKEVRAGAGYDVFKDGLGRYLIASTFNDYAIALHGAPGTEYEHQLNIEPGAVTVNGQPLEY